MRLGVKHGWNMDRRVIRWGGGSMGGTDLSALYAHMKFSNKKK